MQLHKLARAYLLRKFANPTEAFLISRKMHTKAWLAIITFTLSFKSSEPKGKAGYCWNNIYLVFSFPLSRKRKCRRVVEDSRKMRENKEQER